MNTPMVEEYKEPVFDGGDPLEPQSVPVLICYCCCKG
jgi:hypothetical protein